MKLTVSLLLVATCSLVSGNVPKAWRAMVPAGGGRAEIAPAIISGNAAVLGQFPWQAAISITISNTAFKFCGGSLIHRRWVLTAAHCASNGIRYTLRFGSLQTNTGGQVLRSTTAYINPNYNPTSMVHDIALIKLPCSMVWTDHIAPISLLKTTSTSLNSFDISGWGLTADSDIGISQILLWTTVNEITNAQCNAAYPPGAVSVDHLCTLGTPLNSNCMGDSGGALVLQGTPPLQVGVISFVHADGCESGKPAGHIRVVPYLPWITSITGITF